MQARKLRAGGCSAADIAAGFARQHGLNPRVAFRAACGMTQEDVADAWNERWPSPDGEALLAGKQVSYWEQWPGPTGREPSLHTIARLAQIYGCGYTALIADVIDPALLGDSAAGDGRLLAEVDDAACLDLGEGPGLADGDGGWGGLVLQSRSELLPGSVAGAGPAIQVGCIGGAPGASVPAVMWAAGSSAIFLVPGEPGVRSDEVERALQMVGARVDRRGVIKIAAVGPLVAAGGANSPSPGSGPLSAGFGMRVSDDALTAVEQVVLQCRRLDDTLGPRAALPTTLAQADLVEGMLRAGPAERYRLRLLSLLGQIHTAVGFLYFDLKDFDRARWHYEQARSAARDSGDAAVAAFAMGHRSWLEREAGRTSESVECAGVAQAWAGRADSPRVRVYAAGQIASAHAADGAHVYAQQVLDDGRRNIPALTGPDENDPAGALFYWVGPRELSYPTILSALARRDPDAALAGVGAALRTLGPERFREASYMRLFQADAHIQKGDIDAVAASLAHAAELIAQHRSTRTVEHFRSTRLRAGRLGQSRALTELDNLATVLGIPLTPATV